MSQAPDHHCRVVRSPWPGVFATDTDSARTYERHWHATFGFGVMERGAHRSLSGCGTVDAYAGDVITSNPGEVHDGRPHGGPSRRWRMVHLDATALSSMLGAPEMLTADVRLTRSVIHDGALVLLLRQLLNRLERSNTDLQSSPDDVLAIEESLVLASGLLLRRHSTTPATREPELDVRRVRDRLSDPGETPSLSELAAIVGLSKYQLLRRFTRVYAVTPYRWLRQAKVERARASIGLGNPLAQVAADCGFADQSHMTRAFVAHFGFTPAAWKRAASPATRRR